MAKTFFGNASVVSTNNITGTQVAIKQVSAIEYQFYYQTGISPGQGIFTVNTMNTFAYSGASTTPIGTFIYPSNIFGRLYYFS